MYLPCKLPVASLLEWSPFENSVWNFRRPITRLGVAESISRGELETRAYSWKERWRRIDHIRRVAYLVVNPSDRPIEIDVGVPSLGFHIDWPIYDGNHRLGAAIYRNDEFIPVDINGDIDYALDLFGLNGAK